MTKKTIPVERKPVQNLPRVLLGVSIDLTYRCNQNCGHCWLWRPEKHPEAARELSLDEIERIAGECRGLGVREWTLSGGEPMLRPDFSAIFDLLTRKSRFFIVKTNGTLVTPMIARQLAGKGEIWVSLYGASAGTYDAVTRTQGGFEAVQRGIALLREAGARVIVQPFPMRANWSEWPRMVELARSLGHDWRVGASWLNLSADLDPQRNAGIISQRLEPAAVVLLDPPFMSGFSPPAGENQEISDNRILAGCVFSRREAHIDPFGGLSLCPALKDPALRYDLRRGSVREGWEEFIPSLADKVRGTEVYRKNCGACPLREECRWCPAYAYLEHGDPSSPVEHLCAIARDSRRYKQEWLARNRRFYQTGGISLQIDSHLPFAENTLRPAVEAFRALGPGADLIRIRHFHSLEGLKLDGLGEPLLRQGPWTAFRKGDSWIYRCSSGDKVVAVGEFSMDHRQGTIHHASGELWLRGGLNTISLPVTDQLLLARLLAPRAGCILHAAGAILDGQGWLFIGHSGAGKTTVTRLLADEAEILCDDRNIVRRLPEGYRLYGTWSHGESPLVSPNSAPLRAALFLQQAGENRIERLGDRRKVFRLFTACVVRGFVDAGWWERLLDLAEAFSREVPCFELKFTKQADLPAMLRGLSL